MGNHSVILIKKHLKARYGHECMGHYRIILIKKHLKARYGHE